MNFNFVDEEEDSDEDDEFLDLSELEEEPEPQVEDSPFVFEEDIPDPQKLTSPEVKARAKRGRKRGPAKMDYAGKRELGWSLFCSHMNHLPTLCESEMTNGNIDTCTCPCHEERGYVQPEPQSLSGSDDEEILLFID